VTADEGRRQPLTTQEPNPGGLPGTGLPPAEAGYAAAARAPSTLRGYRSDWRGFTAWCLQHDESAMPTAAPAVSGYLTDLAQAGAKVGTMSRRLSAIRFAHQLRNQPDPTRNARVIAVWEGIRRTHGAPPVQAAPLIGATRVVRRRRRLPQH